MAAVVRAWGLALIALAIWFLSDYQNTPHHVANESAAATEFSAARAEAVLARILGPEKPHPVGSAENAAVRARIREEFAKLGVTTATYRAFSCRSYRGLAFASCATVTNIIAMVSPGQGNALMLMAHYDSVPAGPGASDDESGVATVLETVRALKARNTKSLHPIVALITDGEEGGLLGANAFLENPELKSHVGAVVNVEARGTSGPSLLFQTSPGDAPLINLYAKSVPTYQTSSLYAEIYKALPNDTDLTLFIRDGFPSFNFAFADNVRYYHSPRDTRANLDPATLQMHGDNLLGVASSLMMTDFAKLKDGNAIYMSLGGKFLPRLPASWALPLAILLFVVLAVSAWFAVPSQSRTWGRILAIAAMPLALIIGAALFGWILALIAQLISGHPDPTYAHPLAMRLALGFAVWTVTLAVVRMVETESGAASAWLWIGFFGLLTAAFLTGFSPYFLFPAIVAAIALAATARSGWVGPWGQVALLIAALAGFFIWIPLVVSGETLMGLRLHPLFTIAAAFAMLGAVPFLAGQPMTGLAARLSIAISAGAAITLAVVAGLQPAYSKASPQRVNLIYLQKGGAPARWIADTSWKGLGTEPIPRELVQAGPFKRDPDAWEGIYPGDAYVAPAGASAFSLPTARVLQDRVEGGKRIVDIAMHASQEATGVALFVPKEAGLLAITLRGKTLKSDGTKSDTRLLCLTPDCRDLEAQLTLANMGNARISFAEVRYGLPAAGARLRAARPDVAMPSQSGDETILVNSVELSRR